MNKISKFTCTIYGILLIVGGFIGFVKAHSKWSLIIGILSGVLIFLATKIGSKSPQTAYLYVATISLILSIMFAIRFSATYSFMPSGLMLILSTVTLVIASLSYFNSKRLENNK